jgi:hypothetical protein
MHLRPFPTRFYVTTALAVAVVGCYGAARQDSTVKTPKSVTVVASGDTAGWLTPCGCTSNQSGGLLRRASYVEELRCSAEVLLIDAGGAAAGTSNYDRLKFEAILDGEMAMGITAHNLGASEAALGAGYLRETSKRLRAPFISANLKDVAGQLIAEPYRIVDVADRSIAIVGVLSKDFTPPHCKVEDPAKVLLDLIAGPLKGAKSIVVLAYLPEAELKELASQLPEVDLIIGGPTGQCIAPVKMGPIQLASATNKGKFLVSFTAPLSDAPLAWLGQVAEMNERFPDSQDQLNNLVGFRKMLSNLDISSHDSGLGPLNTINLSQAFEVAGNSACKSCHPTEHEQWTKSAHAHSFETLAQKGAEMDSFCQRCHVNAFGRRGGFASAKNTGEQGVVGCESCHGPSRPHVLDHSLKTPFDAKQQCALCHDHENSPEFDYSSYWAKIAHGAAANTSKTTVKETH